MAAFPLFYKYTTRQQEGTMADPRKLLSNAFGLRKGGSIATSNGLQAMLNFCHAANPNNPAATRVSSGLKTLSSISKALGKGGKLPVTIDNVNSNVKWVLGTLGIDTQTVFEFTKGQNNIVDAGIAAAKGVFDKVKAGKFTINDIPLFEPPLDTMDKYISGIRRSREVERFRLAKDPVATGEGHASPWAEGLDKAMPKYKFLFVVAFEFNAPYMQEVGQGGLRRQLSYVARRSTRPGIKYDMQEVNFYNFRSKVITKSEFEDMSMTFYDDSRNSAATLMSAYMSAMTPIVNNLSMPANRYEEQGMLNSTYTMETINQATNAGANASTISQPNVTGSSSSTGPLQNDLNTVINKITLFHIIDNGRRVDAYTFINPRVVSFSMDEVDMTVSEVNTVEMKFTYDNLITDLSADFRQYESVLSTLTDDGKYKLQFNGEQSTKTNGNVQYGETAAARAVRNSCLKDATDMITNTVGAVKNYMNKLF